MRFRDRADAGRQLAERLSEQYHGQAALVFALPRGGVALGVEVAQRLNVPVELVIARKIGHPLNPEYAIGAVTENGVLISAEREVRVIDQTWWHSEVATQRREALRRRRIYFGDRPARRATGKVAIVVDDGIATGLTMEAAIRDLRAQAPARIVVAVPVAPAETLARLRREVDEVVLLDDSRHYLGAVGAYYDDFPQLSDTDVVALLNRHPPAPTEKPTMQTES